MHDCQQTEAVLGTDSQPLVAFFEGDWGSNAAPVYKCQAKLVISLLSGIDAPISFIYISRASNAKSDAKVQVSFTLDAAKLVMAVPKVK